MTTLALGDSAWDAVTLDITSLVAANPATFRNLEGIRITVVPDESPTATAVTGKVLIGGFSFSGSGFSSSSPDLSVHEVVPEEDTDLDAHPFEVAYPDVYRKLHGNETYREDHGIADRSLACVVVDLDPDAEALAELSISLPPILPPGRC